MIEFLQPNQVGPQPLLRVFSQVSSATIGTLGRPSVDADDPFAHVREFVPRQRQRGPSQRHTGAHRPCKSSLSGPSHPLQGSHPVLTRTPNLNLSPRHHPLSFSLPLPTDFSPYPSHLLAGGRCTETCSPMFRPETGISASICPLLAPHRSGRVDWRCLAGSGTARLTRNERLGK